jgi:hypothetical protein
VGFALLAQESLLEDLFLVDLNYLSRRNNYVNWRIMGFAGRRFINFVIEYQNDPARSTTFM